MHFTNFPMMMVAITKTRRQLCCTSICAESTCRSASTIYKLNATVQLLFAEVSSELFRKSPAVVNYTLSCSRHQLPLRCVVRLPPEHVLSPSGLFCRRSDFFAELCAAAAADRMSASRRRHFRDMFTSCCTPAICC